MLVAESDKPIVMTLHPGTQIRACLLVACGAWSIGCGARSELDAAFLCGNGLLEEGERCDDGNRIDHDACDNACRVRTCGNAVLDKGEQCDLGADNEDRPAIVLIHASRTRPVMPNDHAKTATGFYDYFSESSHTGLERVDDSALFLYRDTRDERLALVFHHGIDADATGVTLEHGLVDMDIEGLPTGAGVLIGDEGDELSLDAPGTARGRWEFWRNTDGGALGSLPFPGSWSIESRVRLTDGIRRWTYYDAGAKEIGLDPEQVAILRAFETPSRCRTDCRVPRCGDEFVDGGEVCDDGNEIGGDGCAADCRSLR